MVKVLVVDDSAFSRQTIKKMLESVPGIEVIGVASDGIDAMAKTLRLKPDLITLDFEMPEMDGFSFLRWLMAQRPTPVIMVSSYSDTKTVFKALELGAVDFIAKPSRRASMELKNIEKDLVAKVMGIKGLNMDVLSRNLQLLGSDEGVQPEVQTSKIDIDVVAIGASTGGPPALQIILTKLPSDFPSGIIISQHMPRGFTGPLAERLNGLSKLRIKEAENGDEIQDGVALICPGGCHMTLSKRRGRVYVSLRDAVYEDKYIPSVDIMMMSAAEHYGNNTMGVVLTGMGSDGRKGMLEIKSKGGYTIAESEETAVVFGMPAEVIAAGAAKKVLPLTDIAAEMIRTAKG
ncbi:MAG: chemotaxis response regulator protein-glutamate methylesterase [Thermodesulfovibrionales bacterium]|nr:chemotaxis response regulator protein-glutamate methylesterase [Thermodesulfovibrionales bacterium]